MENRSHALVAGLFLLLLAAYIFFFVSPLLSIAPLFPVYIFTKLFLATRKPSKK